MAQGQTLVLEEVKESMRLYVVNYTHDLPSDHVEIFINPLKPIADFSITNIDDQTVLLEAYENTLPYHEWEIGPGVKFLGPEITYTVASGVTIPVKLKAQNTLGCTAVKVDTIIAAEDDLVLSADETLKSLISEIGIHPNPSSGIFQVVLKELISKPVIITVMDQAGSLIQKAEFGYSNRMTLDLSQVRKGTYILAISSGNEQEFKRVLLQ